MTITVSVEELRDFEAKCHQWTQARSVAVQKLLMVSPSNDDYLRREKTINLTALKAWEDANPFPKLIPTV